MLSAAAGILLWAAGYYASGAEPFQVRRFNIESGLPHNRVNRIVPDPDGFLWICTDDGLARFDGNRFTNYTTAHGLPHAHVTTILKSNAGAYWIGTDAGLSRFAPAGGARLFTNYFGAAGEFRSVNALEEDFDGTIVLGTENGLFRFRPNSPQAGFERIDFGANTNLASALAVGAVARDARGRLWVGTEHDIAGRRTDGSWEHFNTPPGFAGGMTFRFARSPDSRMWVGFRAGFARMVTDPAAGRATFDLIRTEKSGLGFHDVRDLLFTTPEHCFLATDAGLVEWRGPAAGDATEFRLFGAADGFSVEQSHSVVLDPGGNLCVGTRRSGMFCRSRKAFRTFDQRDGLLLTGDQMLFHSPSGRICAFDSGDARRAIQCESAGQFSSVRLSFREW